ncbi:MAG: hypothetical protein VX956_13015, partial [Gemmatimonadota bacterium]|nr:hypothetical protein [Gemmatimonadota bacterium]
MVEETLGHSLSELEAFLEELPALLEFQPRRIVLGGFSQGATTRMAMAISRPDLVTVVIGFSGLLAESVKVPFSALSPGTPPIFWGHGLRNPNIPHKLAVWGRKRLDAAGMKVAARDYDIGHWIAPEEARDAVAFVEAALGAARLHLLRQRRQLHDFVLTRASRKLDRYLLPLLRAEQTLTDGRR